VKFHLPVAMDKKFQSLTALSTPVSQLARGVNLFREIQFSVNLLYGCIPLAAVSGISALE